MSVGPPLGVPLPANEGYGGDRKSGFYSIGANPPPAWSHCKFEPLIQSFDTVSCTPRVNGVNVSSRVPDSYNRTEVKVSS